MGRVLLNTDTTMLTSIFALKWPFRWDTKFPSGFPFFEEFGPRKYLKLSYLFLYSQLHSLSPQLSTASRKNETVQLNLGKDSQIESLHRASKISSARCICGFVSFKCCKKRKRQIMHKMQGKMICDPLFEASFRTDMIRHHFSQLVCGSLTLSLLLFQYRPWRALAKTSWQITRTTSAYSLSAARTPRSSVIFFYISKGLTCDVGNETSALQAKRKKKLKPRGINDQASSSYLTGPFKQLPHLRHLENSGGSKGIRTQDLCDAVQNALQMRAMMLDIFFFSAMKTLWV